MAGALLHDSGAGEYAGDQLHENILQGWLDLQRVWFDNRNILT